VVRGECEALISVVDVAPTLYELAGVDVAGLADGAGDPLVLDGVSFAAQLRDPLAPGRSFVLTEYLRAPVHRRGRAPARPLATTGTSS
jgi:arylsulfatase A-like enzyme